MRLTLNELTAIYSEQLWLEFSQEDMNISWLQAQAYSNQTARWNAYLNLLCLKSFFSFIKNESDLQKQSLEVCLNDISDNIDFPRSSILEFINGTAINIGDTKLVIIPQETDFTDEFCVPKEWVDIPNFAANYYIAIQVNLEAQWVRVWGYTTHRQLKEKGEYDALDRTYSISQEYLIEDINVMWVNQEFGLVEKTEVEDLPSLSQVQADNLTKQLGQPSYYSPRLDVDFKQWAKLLTNDESRKHLYNLRRIVNLREWLKKQNIFDADWKAKEEILTRQQVAFRSSIIMTMRANSSENSIVERARLLDLEQAGEQVALLVGLKPRKEPEMKIWVELYPKENQNYLPSGLKLMVFDEEGKALMQAETRSNKSLQFDFSGESGDRFSIKVALGNFSVTQAFII